MQILCASVQIWCAIASVGAGRGAGRPSSNRELWPAPSRREDIPALPHAAIAHAQFVRDHPSVLGRQRSHRACSGPRPAAQPQAHPIGDRAGLRRPGDRRDGLFRGADRLPGRRCRPIVDALAQAAVASVANGRVLVTDLRGARETWASSIKARADSAVWTLMDLVRQPVVNTAVVQAELGISHTNAMKSIGRLVEIGALAEAGGRRRSILWQASEVLDALDGFATRAGRRRLGDTG